MHIAAVLLAFECLRRLLPEGVALVASAIFAVHPLAAESGQTAAAQADFEHALRLDPELSEARENLRKITGAR